MRTRAILTTIPHPANLFGGLAQPPGAASDVVRSAHVALWRKGDRHRRLRSSQLLRTSRRRAGRGSVLTGVGGGSFCLVPPVAGVGLGGQGSSVPRDQRSRTTGVW